MSSVNSNSYAFEPGFTTNRIVNKSENNNSIKVLNIDTKGDVSTRGKIYKTFKKNADTVSVYVNSANVRTKNGMHLTKIETTVDSLCEFFFNALKLKQPSLSNKDAETQAREAVSDILLNAQTVEVDVIVYHDSYIEKGQHPTTTTETKVNQSFYKSLDHQLYIIERQSDKGKRIVDLARELNTKFNIPIYLDGIKTVVNRTLSYDAEKAYIFLVSVVADLKNQPPNPLGESSKIFEYTIEHFRTSLDNQKMISACIKDYLAFEEGVKKMHTSERAGTINKMMMGMVSQMTKVFNNLN